MTDKKLEIPRKVRVISSYQQIFKQPAGKIVLKDLMNRFHVVGSTFDADGREHARKEGERNVVLHIMHEIGVDTNELLKAIEDSQQEGEE